jgi:hypothetical protein
VESFVPDLIRSHPRPAQIDRERLIGCVESCSDCTDACTICADACLGERELQHLVRCIRLCQDCADICETTGRVASRQTEPDWNVLRSQLEACIQACQDCGEECRKHAAMGMEHCRICAEACRKCEEDCKALLEVIPS